MVSENQNLVKSQRHMTEVVLVEVAYTSRNPSCKSRYQELKAQAYKKQVHNVEPVF